MVKNWDAVRYLFVVFILISGKSDSQESGKFNTYTISSFKYAKTVIRPYEWRYIRVELPPWFSSMSLALESDVNLDLDQIRTGNDSIFPIICFREGSPPLPDVYNSSLTGSVTEYISNGSFPRNQSLRNDEKCYPMQKNILLVVTHEQISPGTWYFGLFNGIGPMRTQSKMINRGSDYYFRGNITVEGCATSMMVGQFCNQTVKMLSCYNNYNVTRLDSESKLITATGKNVIACRNSNGVVCHEDYEPQFYILDVLRISEMLIFAASNVTFHREQPSNVTSSYVLMCFVRLGAVPLKTVYDFSADISRSPLVIRLPNAGRWYITIQPEDISNKSGSAQIGLRACYLLEWQIFLCPDGKAGLNCTFERYMLQTILRKNPSVPFESYYLPTTDKVPLDSSNFPLESLASNYSKGENSWTFFVLGVPSAAAGGNIHIHLTSDTKINYEIYARYGGLPSLNNWDYFYASNTSNSNGSSFFKLYDSTEEKVSFYLLYVQGESWAFGLRQLNPSSSTSQNFISFSLERCPHKCSSHGTCQSVMDTSGLALYSYCACDRTHGGFDCSVELVSHQGHIRQSIFLIVSNAAAVLPAYWALRNKAFAEWVLFTSSGISSALYHACDVGTWCALSFHVLQFFDFWLSFIAVVSTFVYLSSISEVSKRTIHTIVAIVTALMAETGPTRSTNVILVISIGTLCLLVGLLIELGIRCRSLSFATEFHLNLPARWEMIKGRVHNLIKTLIKRFRWGFILAGFITLALATISWKMESTESYWVWHSIWHISIYTASFLFLCSKEKIGSFDNERSANGNYELTRQDSSNRDEQSHGR